jgi:uncharacterized protein
MSVKTQALVSGVFLVLLTVGTVAAASFDCDKASSGVEQIICSDDELSNSGESLNNVYLEALERPDTDEKTIESQSQSQNNERNACMNAERPKTACGARNKALRPSSSRTTSTKVNRPKLMWETLCSDDSFPNSSDIEQPGDAQLWSKALLELQVLGFSTQRYSSTYWSGCNYKSALATLHEIQSQLGKESPYLKIWAANQDRVFMPRQGPSGSDNPPIQPTGESLPRRAQGDFLYQLGSWNFYRRDYKTALTIFKQVAKLRGTPQRANAAYMVARTLAYLNRAEDAYHEIGKILSDPSLRTIHDMAKDYRLVIMSSSRSFDLNVTPKLTIEHLNWLQEIVQLDSKTQKSDRAFAEQGDVFAQLNEYFQPYAPDSKAVDWWLTPGDPAELDAVQTLAKRIPLIDWMQAKWAYNVFDYDWLWALHAKDNPYWAQNRNIVIHALKKWKSEKDGVWLQIAVRRVHPQDSMAEEILAAAEPFLDRPYKTETPEYRLWLFDLWANAVRIRLGRGDTDKVDALVSGHFDLSELDSLPRAKNRSYYDKYHSYYGNGVKEVLDETLRWLVYTGQVGRARSFLDMVQKQFQNDFNQWRSLLATNLDEAISVATVSETPYRSRVWHEMLNLLPSSALYSIANDERVRQERAPIARTVFTRAVLLNYDNDLLDKYAELAGKLNPAIREQLLESVSGHNKDKYIGFLLKMPRFRPAVYLEDAENGNWPDEKPAIDAIDVYNHNDNNWWCRFDDEMFEKRIFNAMKIVPSANNLLPFFRENRHRTFDEDEETKEALGDEVKPYLDNQRRLLAEHPYTKLIDRKEIEALKKIPSGPQYLCEAVIKRELESKPAANPEEQNERAENLHRAVRTTRYSCNRARYDCNPVRHDCKWVLYKCDHARCNCNRDGSHAEYSRKAYSVLHKRYETTPWAKTTPYWFK